MHGQLLNKLISNEFKSRFIAVTAENADPNFEKLKAAVNREIPVKAFISWQDELKNLTKDYYPETVEQNLKILEDYIKLCLQNGAKPICFMFPFAPAMYENYDKNFLAAFRWTIHTVTEKYKTPFIDLFDLKLDYDCFYNMAHLNWKGSISASLALSFGMYKNNILPIENFCTMNYETAIYFSQILDSDSYRNFMRKIYKVSVEKIRRKAKIKIAFVLYDSSMWCGDALYNLFAQNERYEVTIFLCLRIDQYKNEKVRSDFIHGVNQLKSHGLNVVAIDSFDTKIPTQDFIIFLTPYNRFLPRAFYFNSLTAETLTAYIPYSYTISSDNVFAEPIQRIIYKHFCDTKFSFNSSIKNPENSVSATYYSGYPKMDVFFDEKVNFKYDWKMAVPNAKKIIWAPHWSIDSGVFFATFQHNYKFMYEYAKAHPEISWVVKPHPNLLYSAVRSGVFKSAEKFKEYLQAWENLPNAKVETGAYYHAIFATSDGMIQDCGSFIYEYQYTHKPMIFLTCDTQRFNSMGNELMKILYRVDGRDLQGIADSIYKIFVEGNDPLFDARLKFFDENLNYKKLNGMTASEFIFKTISKEFE